MLKFKLCVYRFLNPFSYLLCLFFLFFQTKNLSAQDMLTTTPLDSNYTHIATISEKASFITTDKLLNVYVITERGELVR